MKYESLDHVPIKEADNESATIHVYDFPRQSPIKTEYSIAKSEQLEKSDEELAPITS